MGRITGLSGLINFINMTVTYTDKTRVPLRAIQGSKLARRFSLLDRDTGEKLTLTTYTFRGTIRDKRTGVSVATFAFELEPDPVTSDPDKVVLCSVDAVTMAAVGVANYNYDIELVPPEGETEVVSLMSGTLIVRQEFTT